VIVTGRVASLNSHWNSTHTTILTDVRILPERFAKGSVTREVVVQVPGGEVGDIGLGVEDAPVFTVGERVTVNLVKGRDPGVFEVLGGEQGRSPASKGARKYYYKYSGLHRSPASIYYYVYEYLPNGWNSAIQKGGVTWDGAGSSFHYICAGTTTRTAPVYDGYNVVYEDDLGNGGTIAANYYWYDRRTKHISENDIIFNNRYSWSAEGDPPPTSYDVQNIATHEAGHDLQLDDLYQSYQREMTMYGYGAPGETKKRTLETGDKDGIKYIYGAGFRSTPGPGGRRQAVTN
jgi:hypothetical protein